MNEKEKVAVTIIVLVVLAILVPSIAFWWMRSGDRYDDDNDDDGGDATDLERGKKKKKKQDNNKNRRSKSDAARRRRQQQQQQQHRGRRSHRYSSSGRDARRGRGRQQNWTAVEPSRSRSVNDDPSFGDFDDDHDIGDLARGRGGRQRRSRYERQYSRPGRYHHRGGRNRGTGGWYEQRLRDLKAQTTESTETSDESRQMSSDSGPPIILNVPNDAKTNLVRRADDVAVCIDQENTELVTVSSSMSLSGFPDGGNENGGKPSTSSKSTSANQKRHGDDDIEVGIVNYPVRNSFSSHPSLNKSRNSSSKVDVGDSSRPKSNHQYPPSNKSRRIKSTARLIDMVGMVVQTDKIMEDNLEPTKRQHEKNGQKETTLIEPKAEFETEYPKTKRAPKPIPETNRCVDVHVCPSKTCTLCQNKVDAASGRLKKKQQQEKISGGVQFIQAQKMETGMIKKLQSDSAVRSKWWEVGESFFNLYYRAQVRAVQKQEQREREREQEQATVDAAAATTQSILQDIQSSHVQIYGNHQNQGRGSDRRRRPQEF